jgi:hypothetical protein
MIAATLILFGLAALLERLTGSPFVASFVGRLLARAYQGRLVPSLIGGHYAVYEVRAVPSLVPGMAAQTWGEVVLVRRGEHTLRLEAHEREHVLQYRRWTSLLFWLAYVACWLWGLVRYRDATRAYWQIPFEVAARRAEKLA